MRYSHQTAAERAHSAVAWAALVSGATRPDPLPEEEPAPVLITCPACEGRCEIGRFAGHGYALEPETCGTCEGRGEVGPREVW